MRLQSNSRKILIAAASFAALAAFTYGALFWGLKKKNERVSVLINQIEQNAEQETALTSLKKFVAETATLREKLPGYRVSADGTASFIETLEALGRETGAAVAIESVERVKRPASDTAEDLRLAIHFEGGWQTVVRFLGLLELLPSEIKIEQAFLSRKAALGEKTASSLWRGDVTLLALKAR